MLCRHRDDYASHSGFRCIFQSSSVRRGKSGFTGPDLGTWLALRDGRARKTCVGCTTSDRGRRRERSTGTGLH